MATVAELSTDMNQPDISGVTPTPTIVTCQPQSHASGQYLGSEDVSIENQASGFENDDWINFLTSNLDGNEALPAHIDPLETFMIWNADFLESGVADYATLQQSLTLTNENISIPPNQSQERSRAYSHESADLVLPSLSSEDQQMVSVDYFGHFEGISPDPFRKLTRWYCETTSASQDFITEEVFQAFLELYYEYFADQFDFVHPSILEGNGASWILLLGVAAIGSQYSTLRQASKYATALQELLYRAVDEKLPPTTLPTDVLTWAQIILLRDICLVFGGGKRRQIKHSYGKNTLATLCRLMSISVSEQARSGAISNHAEDVNQNWRRWVDLESRNRLFHTAYYFECLQFLFLQIRPSIDLSERSTSFPTEAPLWKCRNASEWTQATHLPQNPMSKDEQSGINPTPKSFTEGDYLVKLRYTYICVDEKLALEPLLKWPLRQVLPQFNAPHRQGPGLNSMVTSTILYRQVVACVGSRLQTLYPQNPEEMSELSYLTSRDVTFSLFTMLRHVHMRTLHALSRWQASEDQLQSARTELKTWIRDQPILSRRCLFLAVIMFSSLRVKTHYACYDPLALVFASLFIWAYDQLVSPPNLADTVPNLNKILRLDRTSDSASIRDWIHHGGAVRLHVTGVGVLDGATSPTRTLQEFKRVLSSRVGWSTMCYGLADLADEVIHGRQPILT